MVGGLFVWWFQLNGGWATWACGPTVWGNQTDWGGLYDRFEGKRTTRGMFNRAHLASEAQRAYDTPLECVLNGQKGCEVSARAGMDTIKALV